MKPEFLEFLIIAYPLGFFVTWLFVYPDDGYGARMAWIKSACWFIYVPLAIIIRGITTE